MKCCCDEVRELRQYKEDASKLLAEKEMDLVRLGRINDSLREANARLAEENRKLKEGRHER